MILYFDGKVDPFEEDRDLRLTQWSSLVLHSESGWLCFSDLVAASASFCCHTVNICPY